MSKCDIDPHFNYTPPKRLAEYLDSPFPKLTLSEKATDWGKELYLGKSFARQMDLYRAITCFKSALFLIPKNLKSRRLEIEYDIFFSYYMAGKSHDAIDAFETGELMNADGAFPPIKDLLIALYDVYRQDNQPSKAIKVLGLISAMDGSCADKLQLSTAIQEGDIPALLPTQNEDEKECENESLAKFNANAFASTYLQEAKSVSKARTLNAILPGAGYYYAGQKKAALTSFVINALFIGASYQLFERGYIPCALILASLETGWYFGGINGAGLAVAEYNRNLYEKRGYDLLIDNKLYPLLMIQRGF